MNWKTKGDTLKVPLKKRNTIKRELCIVFCSNNHAIHLMLRDSIKWECRQFCFLSKRETRYLKGKKKTLPAGRTTLCKLC